mmetsp:Transcript_1160/g.1958  ORF Transcript_1160/g.1958 Transcript_1160/m.1958 type:complete len:601 (-) Transcript_1160:45-1847(-)|eukprot:CAMPEP_0169077312 /NCGR_PEP_ID=MMETSP1015-20121227/8812_1 /TAXON_ID=342587 /ORGANISM="Karlodinium micrum, Strain CCMP2283" /LENGTH=600 /DNA_ID=CAMNT_0009136829 /DNA_START=144 /DNA_END=1946 /DNA_ORIENTATION=+
MTSTNSSIMASNENEVESSVKRTSGIAFPTCDLKSSAKKRIFSKWEAVPFLSVIILFCVDAMLFGSVVEISSAWSPMETLKRLWLPIVSNRNHSLDIILCIVLTALIFAQLARRPKKDTSKADLRKRPPLHEHLKTASARCQHGSSSDADGTPTGNRGTVSRWNQAIDVATRQGDVAKAGRLLLEFECQAKSQGISQPDSMTYNLVIRACAKQGDYKGAEQWLRRMDSHGVEATLCTYNTILDACAKADNAEACEGWFEKMLSRGIQANVISYATVIHARARRGEETLAEKWLNRMLNDGITPDAVSYNSMIHACGVSGNAVGAERWIEAMKARELDPTVTTYTAVIDACAKAGDAPRAEKWLESMITFGVQPNVVSFSAMIDSCAKACDPARAEYWHNRMVSLGVKPNAHSYSAVINACAKAGDVTMAEKWLDLSEKAGVANDVVIYSSVIDACGKAGDAEVAMKIFRRMQENGVRPHIVAYAALARPFAYRGDFAAVETIAEEMSVRGIAPNEYFIYAQLLSYATARPRQPQRAEQCFRRAHYLGLKANDHVVGALQRAVGRQACANLMNELCHGRPMPQPLSRRGGVVGDKKGKPHK